MNNYFINEKGQAQVTGTVKLTKKDFENILGFRPNCSLETYREQQRCMGLYLHQLELRAIMENVNLSGPPCSATQF